MNDKKESEREREKGNSIAKMKNPFIAVLWI
jgi:hypothetical protein